MLQITNKRHHAKKFASLSIGEYNLFLGLRLLTTLEPRFGSLNVHWDTSVPLGQVGTAANLEQYGMTRHRFQNISYALTFVDDDVVSADPWYKVRCVVNGFNERRQQVVVPAGLLVIDECMVRWDGIPSIIIMLEFRIRQKYRDDQ